jgi:hypothetical protein
MTIEKKNELKRLREVALGESKIHGIIQEKNETLDHLRHNQKSHSFEPQPTLTPKDDLDLPKSKKLSDELKKTQKNKIEDTRKHYDQKIEERARENVDKMGSDHQKEQMDSLSQEEVVLLTEENGVDKVLEYQEEKQTDKDQQTKDDRLPTQMDEKTSRDFWQENEKSISDNVETLEKEPDTLQSMQMDDKQMDDLMDDRFRFEFEKEEKQQDKSKNQDKEKPDPEPSDDYE